jgi:hypothetical protein
MTEPCHNDIITLVDAGATKGSYYSNKETKMRRRWRKKSVSLLNLLTKQRSYVCQVKQMILILPKFMEDEAFWSDADEDWSDDEQENNHQSETVGNRQSTEWNSSKYKPPSDSPLGKYLKKKNGKILGSHKKCLMGMHHFHFTVWLLHPQLCCKHIHRIRSRLIVPSADSATECFPFITVWGGLGIHEALLYQFMSLVMKGVLFGLWSQSINEANNALYAKSHCSYIDWVSEWKMNHPALYNNNNVVMPFSPPRQVGKYWPTQLS